MNYMSQGNYAQDGVLPSVVANVDHSKVGKILHRHKQLEQEKQPWLHVYQLVSEYVYYYRQNFTRTLAPGQFLTSFIFDSTAPRALHQMTSSLLGALYPGSGKALRLHPPMSMPKKDRESKVVKEYYNRATEAVLGAMNNPKAGLATSLEEYMNDQGAFGISGVGIWEDDNPNCPVYFTAEDTKKITIDQDARGSVDTVYIRTEMTSRQIADEYGIDKVSEKVKGDMEAGRFDIKQDVLHAIEPRKDRVQGSYGNDNMPWASIHIEIDTRHILKESGFLEMPVKVCRFRKCMNEKYGRSPGMEVMPDVMEANAMREALIVAIEKILDPPLAVTQDGAAGGGTIDTSAGAINVRNVSGRINDAATKWIEPISTVGNVEMAEERIQAVQHVIKDGFFNDDLTDLNNEHKMTLGEAQMRNQMRGQLLGTVFARQVLELFNPLTERVFNILLGKDLLGYAPLDPTALMLMAMGHDVWIIPDAVLKCMVSGADSYRIEYITPADRMMKAEELQGIQQTTDFLEKIAPTNPGVFDCLDIDELVRKVVEYTGCPEEVVLDTETVKKLRDARAQMQQQAQAMQAQHVQAQTTKNYGQAAHAAAQAGIDPMALLAGASQNGS